MSGEKVQLAVDSKERVAFDLMVVDARAQDLKEQKEIRNII